MHIAANSIYSDCITACNLHLNQASFLQKEKERDIAVFLSITEAQTNAYFSQMSNEEWCFQSRISTDFQQLYK